MANETTKVKKRRAGPEDVEIGRKIPGAAPKAVHILTEAYPALRK